MLGLNRWFLGFFILSSLNVFALQVGDKAPDFKLKDADGKEFSLSSNEDKTWSVLYFYPKAGTPGCTKQACAFRDALKVIERKNAIVYGISTNSEKELQEFRTEHKLNFTLLSDPEAKVSALFDAKLPVLNVSKRYTFIIDEKRIIRAIDDKVEPLLDARNVANKIDELRKTVEPKTTELPKTNVTK